MKTNETKTESRYGNLHDLRTGDYIRPATLDERTASRAAAKRDGGVGAIRIGNVTCYVAE